MSSIIIPETDGYIGILPHHAPLLAALGYGVLTLRREEGEQDIIIDGGFLEILDNQVTVLANSAAEPGELNLEKSEQDLKEAQEFVPRSPMQAQDRENRIAAAGVRIKYIREKISST